MKKNIAVIGCGYWGKNLVRNFTQLGALRTVCDANSQNLDNAKSIYQNAILTTDYHDVLRDEEIEGVVIAAPAALHYSMAKEAILAGKDIFVEKPLALHVVEGEELVKLADENKRILMVGHLLEYHPAVIKLKELVDSGELGKIQYIYSNRLNLGKFRTEENILWSFAPHDVSVILLLMSGEMPEEVSANGGYYLHQDIADVTLSTMKFSNGVRAHLFVSWLNPYKEQRLVVVGDKKMALFDDTVIEDKLILYSHHIDWVNNIPTLSRKEGQAVKVSIDEPLRLECQDFLTSMEARRKPRVDGHKGLQVLRVLSGCQRSIDQNGLAIRLNNKGCKYFVHETSIVEEPCEIGDGTNIWHFSHLMPGVIIGRNCVIGQNVFVGKGVTIGNNVKIENNVSVFAGVVLEDDVFCGPSCVFTNVINPRSHISRKDEFKQTIVKNGATIGANATIVCGNSIGEYAFIGAGAVVTRDVPNYAMVYGNPARVQGWICHCGINLEDKDGGVQCPACRKKYQIKDRTCTPLQE
ncbi:Gfo/Idh/MocA family oxidoreductase [Chloroflexota bacterium]